MSAPGARNGDAGAPPQRSLAGPADLLADCAACCGLCCVAPPFDALQGFGFDKPAHEACRHLQTDFRCAIHDDLCGHGFAGCAGFDCHGAGQRVTQQVFAGATWKTAPELAQRMFEVYGQLRAAHELMARLTMVLPRIDDASLADRVRRCLNDIRATCDACTAAAPHIEVDRMERDARALLSEFAVARGPRG